MYLGWDTWRFSENSGDQLIVRKIIENFSKRYLQIDESDVGKDQQWIELFFPGKECM